MMKMADTQEIQSIAIQLKDLTEKLDRAIVKEREFSFKADYKVFYDRSLHLEDAGNLITISSYADDETGITPRLITALSAASLSRLEEKGYLRHVSGEGQNGEYELLNREKYLKLGAEARFIWNDERCSFEERAIYIFLCCLSDNRKRTVSISVQAIARAVRTWEYHARKSLRTLENYGLITKERRPGKPNAYRINEQAYKNPEQEKTDTVEG
jgi:DNA-binding HxlR family transcriptional regulator